MTGQSKYNVFLWILLAFLVVIVAGAAIFDGVTHPTISQPSSSITPQKSSVKTGWKVDEQAPDFELTTIENRDIKLSDYLGKNVVLNFWATWCGPCRYEIPILQSLNDDLAKQGIVILAVSTQDSFENTGAYAKQNKLNFIIPVDPRGAVSGKYNVRGIPTTYFINSKGIVTSIKVGPFVSELELTEMLSSFN